MLHMATLPLRTPLLLWVSLRSLLPVLWLLPLILLLCVLRLSLLVSVMTGRRLCVAIYWRLLPLLILAYKFLPCIPVHAVNASPSRHATLIHAYRSACSYG